MANLSIEWVVEAVGDGDWRWDWPLEMQMACKLWPAGSKADR